MKPELKDVLPWMVSSGIVVIFLIGFFFIFIPVDSGLIVYEDSSTSQVQEILKIFLGEYSNLSDLILASFGAVSFLVTYQYKVGAILSNTAWAYLSAGIILMAGALILCFLGKEQLLTMAARNAIDFNLSALKFGRWAMYMSLTSGAVLIGFFALQVAVLSKKTVKATDAD